ncbi:MAG: MarR family transcriptional regulator [Demequinaceae bacterium]|nr:MarR family transcriptional regulator [Demequinaceae bacterium]
MNDIHETEGRALNNINNTGAPTSGAHDHEEREDNLVRLLGRTARVMRSHLEATLGDVPGGMGTWWVLRHLHNAGPQAQSDIARSVGVADSTLTRRMEQMEADGLITRAVDDADNRRVIVSISEQGEALRTAQRERTEAEEGRLVEGVTPDDLEAFDRVIKRIHANLKALGTDPDSRGKGHGGGRGFRTGYGPGRSGGRDGSVHGGGGGRGRGKGGGESHGAQ